ncbi:MAG: hypothetical protein ACKO96_14465 [Flammeovirgaceae bacterium]
MQTDMVMVYKTSVETQQQVLLLKSTLDKLAGVGNWNFALDDTDRILRVASPEVDPMQPPRLLQQLGFNCIELQD